MAATLDDVLSTTLEKYVSTEVRDNIFDSLALFFLLKSKARSVNGGTYLEEPIMGGKSSATGSYSGYDQLSVTAQQGIAKAEFNWKQYYASIVLDGLSEHQNMGDTAMLDLLEIKANQARMSLKDVMCTDAYGDGTGNGSKALDGLAIAIDSAGTYGGISRTTSTWWSANETAVSGALTLARMRTMWNNCSAGGAQGGTEHPDLILTTQAIYEFYEALLQPDQRFQNTKLADGGFANLEFKGTGIVWDESCTADTVYFVNSHYLNLKFHAKRNFSSRPFQTPVNQDAKVSLILWLGNVTGSNGRRQGKLTGVTS